MSPEEKKLLEETLELAKENNQILHSMRRSMRFQRMMTILYWVLIVGSAVGAYYFIQPYVDQMIGIYNGASGALNNLKQFGQ